MELLVSAARWRWILHYECKYQSDELTTLYSNVHQSVVDKNEDSMVRHNIGPNLMYCGRTSCLNLSANGSAGATSAAHPVVNSQSCHARVLYWVNTVTILPVELAPNWKNLYLPSDS